MIRTMLKKNEPLEQKKQNQNQSHHVRVIFPALRVSYRQLLGIVIGS